ncbi:hypothetical protein V6N13_014261 [Hibiscus sabdariffa]
MQRRRPLMEEPPISVSTVVFSKFLLILGSVAVQDTPGAEVGHVGQVDQIVAGGFNVISLFQESSVSSSCPTTDMVDFQECLDQSSFV